MYGGTSRRFPINQIKRPVSRQGLKVMVLMNVF
jgi:hypothetical protein